MTIATPVQQVLSAAERLNQTCFCVTLDRDALCEAMQREAGDASFCETQVRARPNLFSNVPVFLSASVIVEMAEIVRSIEAVAKLPQYRAAVLSWAPEIARRDYGPAGALMGYDFHIGEDGPKLIEINTNAGGAFLNALLAKAQRACCTEIEPAIARAAADSFQEDVAAMFRREWRLQRSVGTAQRIAIVDDQPEAQYLYPEFVLAERMLSADGVDAVIADAGNLRFSEGRLHDGLGPIDLVYNRLTDFSFSQPDHVALAAAYRDGAVVVTPSPYNHALFADKRNLSLLSDSGTLAEWGVAEEARKHLLAIPRTVLVSVENHDELWETRRSLFFKPTGGYGGKAVYRGDKMTKSVWAEVLRGGYVAQTLVRPSERKVWVDDAPQERKLDVRLYTYDGQVVMTAARLYQGQTTNFRTPGGGFAPVFTI